VSCGTDRGYLLEKILAEQPDISSVQLVEALAAEILNPQQAVEFRQCLLADGVTTYQKPYQLGNGATSGA